MKAREILWLIIIGILLALSGFLGYTSISKEKRIKVQATTINALLHPLITSSVRHDSIQIKDTTIYKPYPVKVIVVKVDSIPYPVPGTISWYDSTYRNGGVRFRWQAKVLGAIDEIQFSDLVFPKDIVTITTHVDTCIEKLPVYLPKNHLGVDFNLSGPNFKEMPNAKAVLFWSIKDRVKLNAGAQYDFRHSQLLWEGGFGIYFK